MRNSRREEARGLERVRERGVEIVGEGWGMLWGLVVSAWCCGGLPVSLFGWLSGPCDAVCTCLLTCRLPNCFFPTMMLLVRIVLLGEHQTFWLPSKQGIKSKSDGSRKFSLKTL